MLTPSSLSLSLSYFQTQKHYCIRTHTHTHMQNYWSWLLSRSYLMVFSNFFIFLLVHLVQYLMPSHVCAPHCVVLLLFECQCNVTYAAQQCIISDAGVYVEQSAKAFVMRFEHCITRTRSKETSPAFVHTLCLTLMGWFTTYARLYIPL